ncbi:GTP cyclohydrolase I [Enterococcus faecium]|nr:GTP cyclohydrolase I [Enterococcus faecium]
MYDRLQEDPASHLEKTFDITQNDPIIVKDIEFYSMCEHHFAPFFWSGSCGLHS